jgi:hypothetical protein
LSRGQSSLFFLSSSSSSDDSSSSSSSRVNALFFRLASRMLPWMFERAAPSQQLTTFFESVLSLDLPCWIVHH